MMMAKNIMGWQIADKEGDYPDALPWSFRVYTLSACLRFLLSNTEDKWQLIPIHSGDVGGATYISGGKRVNGPHDTMGFLRRNKKKLPMYLGLHKELDALIEKVMRS